MPIYSLIDKVDMLYLKSKLSSCWICESGSRVAIWSEYTAFSLRPKDEHTRKPHSARLPHRAIQSHLGLPTPLAFLCHGKLLSLSLNISM